MQWDFSSKVFETQVIRLGDTEERIVRGGRDRFALLPKAFEGIKQIGVIGSGLTRSSPGAEFTRVPRRHRHEGQSRTAPRQCLDGAGVRAAGFTEENGTLGEMFAVMRESDMVLLLIADAAQGAQYKEIFAALKPGATLGLSHGFLLGHLENEGARFPDNINVIGVCPKGDGPLSTTPLRAGQRDQRGRASIPALRWCRTSMARRRIRPLAGPLRLGRRTRLSRR